MHAVAFSARQRADLLLLVGASEIEGGAIGARVHLALAELNDVLPAGDFLPDVLVAVERVAGLIDVAETHRFPDLDAALVGLFLPRARGSRDPFTLARERALARRLLAPLLLQPLLLLLEPGRIIALVGNAAAAVELENPASDVVEEVAVVGDDQDRTRVVAQVGFEPVDRLGVEMVGRLIEQQQLRLLEQQAAERHPASLAAG